MISATENAQNAERTPNLWLLLVCSRNFRSRYLWWNTRYFYFFLEFKSLAEMTNTSRVNYDTDVYSKQLIVNLFITGQSERTWPAIISGSSLWLKSFQLRCLEIVFIFPRLVLQILFQMQFGLSYQCEICPRNKWNVIESLHHIFFSKNLLPWQPYNAFSCTPKMESYCVIKRTGRWNLLKLLYYTL